MLASIQTDVTCHSVDKLHVGARSSLRELAAEFRMVGAKIVHRTIYLYLYSNNIF